MTKRQSLWLVVLCYGVALLMNLCAGLYACVYDSLARANGTLQTHELNFTDFETVYLDVSDPVHAVTNGEDAQLILRNLDTRVTSVSFAIRFSKAPGEVTLYYAAAGKDFSKENKIYGKPKSDGSYEFALPHKKMDALRVDPTNLSGLSMELEHFTLNAPRSVFSYFHATYEDMFRFAVYPALVAAVLGYLLGLLGPQATQRVRRGAQAAAAAVRRKRAASK